MGVKKWIIRVVLVALVLVGKTGGLWGQGGGGATRIVSLGPFLTEEIFLLGAQDQLVGVTVHCRRPTQAKEKEAVGTAVDANVEKIAGLHPNLVMATALTSSKSVGKLKALGVNVVVFSSADSYRALCDQFMQVARLVGKEREAWVILDEARGQIEAARSSTGNGRRPRVFVQLGARPLWVATKASFLNDLVEMAGGRNLGPEGTNGRFSREKLLALDPDVILITSMGTTGEREKAQWESYPSLSAAKHKGVFIVDSELYCSPTPVSFAQAVKEAAVMLRPLDE